MTWRIVTAPAGAHPQLQGRRTAHPRFWADRPGVYQVALRVRQRSRSELTATEGPYAEDVQTLDVGPTLTALGLYVDTTLAFRPPLDVSQDASFVLECVTYPLLGEYLGTGSRYVTLDETTLAPVHVDAPAAGTEGLITVGTWENDSAGSPDGTESGSQIRIGTTVVETNETNLTQQSEGVGLPFSASALQDGSGPRPPALIRRLTPVS